MEALTIRPATEHDIETIQYIGSITYRDHFASLWTPDGIERFLAADFTTDALRTTFGSPAHHLWLLAYEADGREPVGFAKINWAMPEPIQGQRGAELQKIYFTKACVGKGYGKQLLDHIVACARQHAQQQLWLDVLKSNTGAQQFYQRSGFRPLGEIPFKTDLHEIGMLVMTMGIA
ncbi:GNAT family N-acetyltransferase [Paludibacterium yongneupense]|uniref:GNAT family N-acetyltransferase n=1 Tax=Paludibacterium yongneupense TaxID=400061 RepID=UPI0003FA86E7|nr:N-acetyltransferase [Paludibacterium yongneupense]